MAPFKSQKVTQDEADFWELYMEHTWNENMKHEKHFVELRSYTILQRCHVSDRKKCGQRFTLFCVKIELLFVTRRWCNVKSQKASGIEFIGKWTIQNVRLWQTLRTSSNKKFEVTSKNVFESTWSCNLFRISINYIYFIAFLVHLFKKVCSHKKESHILQKTCRKVLWNMRKQPFQNIYHFAMFWYVS